MDLEKVTRNHSKPGVISGYATFAQQGDQPPMSLSDAIHSLQPYEKIVQIIEDNPESVKQKGWHGLTPLHKAGLRGEVAITKLLIEHEANIDEPNEYGETPLHFACKRGHPANIHEMVRNGGDIRVADKQGRNALHHAAAGGGVSAMHYLSEVCGMSFNDKDRNGQLCIHIACYQGFQDAVKYLLRNQRSEPGNTDNFGNTAVHIACINALNETCWTLLERSHCAILKQANRDGKTPLDILRDGRSASHMHLHKELEYWSRSHNPKAPPRGPLFTWFFMLFLPMITFPVIVYISSFFSFYSGLVVCVLTMMFASYVSTRSHRLPHMCKWSNPIYAGAFGAGLAHTMVCYFVVVLPDMWQDQPVFHFMFEMPLFCAIIYLYLFLLVRDPGTCRISKPGPSLSEPCMTIKHVARGLCELEEFCMECELVRPERTRHCRLCKKCRLDIDHHCLFLLTCVSKNNHRQFVIFIFLTCLAMLTFLMQSLRWLVVMYPHGTWWDLTLLTCQFQSWLLALMLLNFVSIFWGVTLLRFQLRVISMGITTLWMPKSTTSKGQSSKCSHRGRMEMKLSYRMKNLQNFFAGKRTYTPAEMFELHSV